MWLHFYALSVYVSMANCSFYASVELTFLPELVSYCLCVGSALRNALLENFLFAYKSRTRVSVCAVIVCFYSGLYECRCPHIFIMLLSLCWIRNILSMICCIDVFSSNFSFSLLHSSLLPSLLETPLFSSSAVTVWVYLNVKWGSLPHHSHKSYPQNLQGNEVQFQDSHSHTFSRWRCRGTPTYSESSLTLEVTLFTFHHFATGHLFSIGSFIRPRFDPLP